MNSLMKLTLVLTVLATFNHAKAQNIVDVKFPTKWKVAGPVPKSVKISDNEHPDSFDLKTLKIEGKEYAVREITVENGTIDFADHFYANPKDANTIKKHTADKGYAFTEIDVPEDGELLIGAGADWWMEWYLDGKSVQSTMSSRNVYGNFDYTNHAFAVKVTKGKHILSVKVASGSRGWLLKSAFGSEYNETLADLKVKHEEHRKKLKELRENFNKLVLKNSRLKIAVYGSSVAKGAGAQDEFGWANMLGKLLEKNNWTYVNKSVGGDTTKKLLARIHLDLLPEKPDVVIIGLSLANEGIRGGHGRVYNQYVRNMKKIIQVLRKNGIVPMVANCYPNGGYTASNYAFVKKFNEELERWPVASFDFMGAIDNGKGQWVDGSWADKGHPNDFGHTEMLLAIPPSAFDHFMEGDLSAIAPVTTWYDYKPSSKDALAMKFRTKYLMRSFTYAFDLKFPAVPKAGSVIGSVNNNEIRVSENNTIVYTADNGEAIDSEVKIVAGKTYQIALAHRSGLKKTTLYVNNSDAKSLNQMIKTQTFTLGGGLNGNSTESSFRNVSIYRSCKRADQIKRLFDGVIGYSSLEIFSPLNDGVIQKSLPVINLAQTSSKFIFLDKE